jgi:hypothetical protein
MVGLHIMKPATFGRQSKKKVIATLIGFGEQEVENMLINQIDTSLCYRRVGFECVKKCYDF